jgi:ABC-type multidrug transport system ATPase subunit
VLINALTLDAFFGKIYGSVTLNGVPLTDKIFKEHCYVVVQQDKHFPYLTCRETLQFAAELYNVAPTTSALTQIVEETIDKMGLRICSDTRNSSLSGGQARRLSIGIALLKQPTLMFLDEPTSGMFESTCNNATSPMIVTVSHLLCYFTC